MYPRPDVHFLMPANRGALQSAPEKPITNPPCSKLRSATQNLAQTRKGKKTPGKDFRESA